MDRTICDICNASLSTTAIAEQHERGKKHQRNLALHQQKLDLLERSVFLYNYPSGAYSEEDIMEFFTEKYGPISRVLMPKTTCAILEFEAKESADKAKAEEKIFLRSNVPILIKGRELKDSAMENEEIERALHEKFEALEEGVLSSIALIEGFDAQAEALVGMVQLKEEDRKERLALVETISQSLVELFPKFHLIAFGSSVNTLGMVGCDLDISFELEKEKAQNSLLRSRNYLLSTAIPDLKGEKRILTEEWFKLNRTDKIRFLTRMINYVKKENNLPISVVRMIHSNRCPLVRFAWNKTIICDLSVQNRTGVANSDLLRSITESEPLFRPISILVRFWAKLNTGITGNDSVDLNSYSLTILLLSYLRKEGGNISREGSFAKNILRGFFDHYSHFKFKESVVIGISGKVVPIEEFKKAAIGSTYHKDFKYSLMNVQDPTDYSHNTAGKTGRKSYQKFKESLLKSTAILQRKNTSLADLLNVSTSESSKTPDNMKSVENSISIQSQDIGQTSMHLNRVLCDLLDFTNLKPVSPPPAKKMRQEVYCEKYASRWASWEGRRKKRREVLKNNPSLSAEDSETEVTRLLKTMAVETDEPLLEVETDLQENGGGSVLLTLNKISGPDLDFNNFMHFFFGFIEKFFKL